MERFLYVETLTAGDLLIPISKIRSMLPRQKELNVTQIYMTEGVQWTVNHSVAEIAAAIYRTPEQFALIKVTQNLLPESASQYRG